MPGRKLPLITDEIYHVMNKGIDDHLTFSNKRELDRAVSTLDFYRFSSPPIKFSRFVSLKEEEKSKIYSSMVKTNKHLVEILCFCLMPTHFHLLLKQVCDGGISKFLSNFQNSHTRYFNTSHERKGSLFYDQFNAVRIVSNAQLLHVQRYIHINPLTSFIVKDFDSLLKYPWSSLPIYQNPQNSSMCSTELILSQFKNTNDFLRFLSDHADYQRTLHLIKLREARFP
ncbi:transposase [Candidatus Collierbacteria bacterium]|nr:transposase [Candidatus Collierbacteria bacterium]